MAAPDEVAGQGGGEAVSVDDRGHQVHYRDAGQSVKSGLTRNVSKLFPIKFLLVFHGVRIALFWQGSVWVWPDDTLHI